MPWSFGLLGAAGSISPILADILVIAGGGSGGQDGGGGGGAGAVVYFAGIEIPVGVSNTVLVGAGGSSSNGSNSSFGNLTAAVGGGRGGYVTSINGDLVSIPGAAGGSGGGGPAWIPTNFGTSNQTMFGTTAVWGNSGGLGRGGSYDAGGGGGAGGRGTQGSSDGTRGTAGSGGTGTSVFSSWGLATSSGQNSNGTVYFAGGGSGCGRDYRTIDGVPGLGGGGLGNSGNQADGSSGTANTGGGGGGMHFTSGYTGGSGIVIVRTAGSITAAGTTNSPTRYESGGYTYYKFASSGTITF